MPGGLSMLPAPGPTGCVASLAATSESAHCGAATWCSPFWRLPVAVSLSLIHPRDKRPVFIYPWEGVTVVGTTDLDHDGDLQKEAVLNQQEMDYLLEAAHFAFPDSGLSAEDLISTWSGVRPVVSDAGAGKNKAPSRKNANM